MKVKTANRSGKYKNSAVVYSNDPQNPKQRISISCIVKPYIIVKPTKYIRLIGYEGDKLSNEVTITSVEEHPFEITNITTDNGSNIEYELRTIQEGRKYSLEVKNRTSEEGFYKGKIVLETNSLNKPKFFLPVLVKLNKEVVIMGPPTRSYGTILTSRKVYNEKRLKQTVLVQKLRGDGLTIKEVKSSKDWILTEAETIKEGKQYAIIITLDKDKLPKGKFKEQIDIFTNYKKGPLVVNVEGEVR